MKQSTYIIRGFLLLLVLVIAAWFINILLNIKPAHSDKHNNQELALEQKRAINNGSDGAKLFSENCASCHSLIKDLTGPALMGIEERVTDKKLLYAWIRNSQAVLKSGDKYFNDLYNRYGKVSMMQFPQLSDKDIGAILQYITQTNARQYLPAPAVAAN